MATSTPTRDESLIGAAITFGPDVIGQVAGVLHDPVSGRVRYLITAYGVNHRRVAVPMEWVLHQTSRSVALGVGTRSLDDLPDVMEALHLGVN
jgi:hypothetical protein